MVVAKVARMRTRAVPDHRTAGADPLPTGGPGSGDPLGLLAGDVVLIQTTSGIGRIVRALDRSEFNHCAVCVGDGLFVHVLPPASMRGSCVTMQSWPDLVDTLAPTKVEARRPSADVRDEIAGGALEQLAVGPAFSYNDLLVLAVVADTSDRLEKAIAPVGPFLDDQRSWELLLGAHFALGDGEAITCSGLVTRAAPSAFAAALPRRRGTIPDEWQEEVTAGPLLDEVRSILAPMGPLRARSHRRRGYAPAIAALDAYATGTGPGPLGARELRVALSVLRVLARDFCAHTPFDLARLRELLDVVDATRPEVWSSRLTTPGDLARATEQFAPIEARLDLTPA